MGVSRGCASYNRAHSRSRTQRMDLAAVSACNHNTRWMPRDLPGILVMQRRAGPDPRGPRQSTCLQRHGRIQRAPSNGRPLCLMGSRSSGLRLLFNPPPPSCLTAMPLQGMASWLVATPSEWKHPLR
jgi:hypothetical protein